MPIAVDLYHNFSSVDFEKRSTWNIPTTTNAYQPQDLCSSPEVNRSDKWSGNDNSPWFSNCRPHCMHRSLMHSLCLPKIWQEIVVMKSIKLLVSFILKKILISTNNTLAMNLVIIQLKWSGCFTPSANPSIRKSFKRQLWIKKVKIKLTSTKHFPLIARIVQFTFFIEVWNTTSLLHITK